MISLSPPKITTVPASYCASASYLSAKSAYLAVVAVNVATLAWMFAYESIVTLPEVVPSSPDVVAKANSSADSSHKNETFADEPLSMNRPTSAELAPDTPLFK